MRATLLCRTRRRIVCGLLVLAGLAGARGEAMLELFQMNWTDVAQKMPELAEAGYTSLWLPPPAKGGSVFSVGYDLFDPLDRKSTRLNSSHLGISYAVF